MVSSKKVFLLSTLGFGQFEDGTAENIGKLCTIKVLQLNGMVVNQSHLVHIVNKLELLQVLHVKTEACISGGNLGEIVRNANQLKELKIDALGLTFNFDNYHEILTTVQKRMVPTKLELWIFGENEQPNVVTNDMNDQNKKWLIVKELHRHSQRLFPDLKSKIRHAPPLRHHWNHYSDSDSDEYSDEDY